MKSNSLTFPLPILNLSHTLRSWVLEMVILFRTFAPQYENNSTLKCSSDNFPSVTHMSAFKITKCLLTKTVSLVKNVIDRDSIFS